MKLKYKKIILGVTLGTMIVGLTVLSLNHKKDDSAKETSGKVTEENATKADASTPTIEPTADPTSSELEKNKYPEVNDIVAKYFQASLKSDMDTLSQIVSETENISKDVLERRYEYVEDIKNIDCYTVPGPDEDSHVVFVYYEMKLVNIDTMAPGLVQMYITKASDDRFVILLSQLDDTMEEYVQKALKNQAVIELFTTVNTKMEQAIASDEKLKQFVSMLNASVAEAAVATEAPAPADGGQPADGNQQPADGSQPADGNQQPAASEAPAAQ